MAPKITQSHKKLKPATLQRGVSFGEERNGAIRVTRPGTSPTSPEKPPYPKTPPLERKSKRVVKPTPKKKKTNATKLTSALTVKIRQLENGDLVFTDGSHKWRGVPLPITNIATTSGVLETILSSPTSGFKDLPALLHGGVDFMKDGKFKIKNTSGWKYIDSSFDEIDHRNGAYAHEEKWVYVGEDSPPSTPKMQTGKKNSPSPPGAPKKKGKFVMPAASPDSSDVTSLTFGIGSPNLGGFDDGLTDWGQYVGGQPPRVPKAATPTPAPVGPTKRAQKNKKAREKKAVAKMNKGKREKLPYVPKAEMEKGKRSTRSEKGTKKFYALP